MTVTRDRDALALVTEALRRLDALHRRTGCVADRDDEAVLTAAAAVPAGLLHGEPITVKDWIDVAGFRCSGGQQVHAERRPEVDATAVARLRAAGAVVVAKTAVQVDSERFGRVSNPRDSRRSPGGSSSGDAAAVAGGAVRLGIGSDSGGSVRVPAAWCGVVGLKPSAGLVPTTGHFPRIGARSDGRTVLGAIAAHVDLAWRAIEVMAGLDDADGGAAPVRLGDPADVSIRDLRICIGSPGQQPVAPEVQDALHRARSVLSGVGAHDAGLPPDWLDEALRVTQAYWQRHERTGAQVEQDLEDWDRFRRRVLREHRDVDVIITPTVAAGAPLHRPMCTDDYLFCLPASLAGAPAISIPLGESAVQVIARRWSDHVAVAVARVIERKG